MYDRAAKKYEEALKICERVKSAKGIGICSHQLGFISDTLGQYQKALEFYDKALALKKKIGVPYDGTEDSISNVYLTMGDIQAAEPVLKKVNRWVSLGRLALAKHDYDEAGKLFQSRLGSSLKNRQIEGLFTGHTGLGLSCEGLNQYDKAAEHFKQAIDLTEQVRDSLTPAQRANFYDARIWNIPRITPYEGLTRVLIKIGKPEQSFRESEGTKARVFAESLSGRSQGIVVDVPRSVLEQDADINSRLAGLGQSLQKAHEKGSKDAIESFEKQVKEVRSERDRHIENMRKEYPLYAATRYPQSMNLEHSALKDDEWVLEYQVTETGVCIYLTHGKKLVKALFKPVARKEVNDLARNFREPLKLRSGNYVIEKLKSFDFASGRKLSDLLVSDILTDLPKDARVIIIPDGPLGVIPFEALVLNDTGKIS